MKKVLVIQLQQIGDVLLSTAICQKIKEEIPDVEVHYLVAEFTKGVAENHPFIDKLVIYKKNQGLFYQIGFLKKIRKEKYDFVIDILCKPRSGVFTLLSGAKKRISFKRKGRGFFYNHLVPKPNDRKEYVIDLRSKLLEPIGINAKVTSSAKIYLEPELIDLFKSKLMESGISEKDLLIAFGINSRRPFKVWPAESFVKVIDHCIEKYNAKILFFFNEKERGDCLKIKSMVKHNDSVITDIQTSSIRELAALLKNCDLFVGNDSGPRHISQAVDTPTFAVYSPSASKWNWNVSGDSRFQAIDLQDGLGLSDEEFQNLLKGISDENAPEYLQKIPVAMVIEKVDNMIDELNLMSGVK